MNCDPICTRIRTTGCRRTCAARLIVLRHDENVSSGRRPESPAD
jgi:hypothetical protein